MEKITEQNDVHFMDKRLGTDSAIAMLLWESFYNLCDERRYSYDRIQKYFTRYDKYFPNQRRVARQLKTR